ncbi:MAG: beta-lactamase family protein [Lentisphaerales bacterium]|nr:beta-lactamase family protein [Lentisphaerales bacterium]
MEIGKENFPNTLKAIQNGIDQELHTCAQVYISQYEEALADFAMGEYLPEKACSINTYMPWMSCSKMVTAISFALLVERGSVDWHTNVAEVIPEFGCNGKEDITFHNILTHTCGLRILSLKYETLTWAETISQISAMPVEKNWTIGIDAGYHVATSWFILGEAVQRLSAQSLNNFITTEIFQPLEMEHCSLAMPIDQYLSTEKEIAKFYRTDTNPIRFAVDHYETSKNICKPGSSGRGPMRELAKFMEMLGAKGTYKNRRILSERTIEEMIKPQRIDTQDKTFMCKIDWGLAFMLDSKHHQESYPYSFGPGCSEDTFGHNGNQSSAAYVDLEHELTVCFGFNGLPGEKAHQIRLHETNEAIYKDLDIL